MKKKQLSAVHYKAKANERNCKNYEIQSPPPLRPHYTRPRPLPMHRLYALNLPPIRGMPRSPNGPGNSPMQVKGVNAHLSSSGPATATTTAVEGAGGGGAEVGGWWRGRAVAASGAELVAFSNKCQDMGKKCEKDNLWNCPLCGQQQQQLLVEQQQRQSK